MIRRNASRATLFIAVFCLAAGGAAGVDPVLKTPPREICDVEGVEGGGLFLDGRAYLSGQPCEVALGDLIGRGVELVINVRTPDENSNRESIPFDEATFVRELGIAYVEIPLGGDHGYDTDAVARLADVLDANEGQVLIHCGYGVRAAYLWLAYLVEHEGLPLDQAMERGEAMMLKQHPIGRLLGRPTALVFVEKASAPS